MSNNQNSATVNTNDVMRSIHRSPAVASMVRKARIEALREELKQLADSVTDDSMSSEKLAFFEDHVDLLKTSEQFTSAKASPEAPQAEEVVKQPWGRRVMVGTIWTAGAAVVAAGAYYGYRYFADQAGE
jgi:hypothetical protein